MNRRHHLREADMRFMLETLTSSEKEQNALFRLLADPSETDRILDDDRIFNSLLESPDCLNVSPHFYFYILVRHTFLQAGIDDRDVADYVATFLEEFSQRGHRKALFPNHRSGFLDSVDILEAISQASPYRKYFLYVFAGNHFLFLTGLFADYIHCREERRGAPGLNYYEEVGRTSYQSAWNHPLSREFALESVYEQLSSSFSQTRRALNDCSERLLMLN